MERLYFHMYNAGLTEGLLSLEVGAALGLLTDHVAVPFGLRPPPRRGLCSDGPEAAPSDTSSRANS